MNNQYQQGCSCSSNRMSPRQSSCSRCPRLTPENGCLETLVPAMAYVPMQEFGETFPLPLALKNGTIFMNLCKPFCGMGWKGGCSRC